MKQLFEVTADTAALAALGIPTHDLDGLNNYGLDDLPPYPFG